MARALLLFERQADASWLPTTVILATPERLRGRCLPGDLNREARLASIVTNALPPRLNDDTKERGTWEDWIEWALDCFSNGHTMWAVGVVPTETVEALYRREVALSARPPSSRIVVADEPTPGEPYHRARAIPV
jgi:hypothetical protein